VVSLLEKILGRTLALEVYEIPSTVPHMGLSEERQQHVISTQFRSFDYLPLLAATLVSGTPLPVSRVVEGVPPMPQAICWADSFGNLKTSVLPAEAGFRVGASLLIQIDEQRQMRLPCYQRLTDIPDNKAPAPPARPPARPRRARSRRPRALTPQGAPQVAVTVGSSGLGAHRLLEIVQQGASAAATLALRPGMRLEFINPE